ncbi:MAG: 3-coathanger stack domain-containing protein, partial [Bacteroidota bacterium]
RPLHETQIQFTSDPNILYALNNDFGPNLRTPKKSADGGDTWTNLATDPTGGDVWSIFADPNNTNRLLVSSYGELFFSSNGGTSFTSVYSASDLYLGGVFWDGVNIFVGCRTGLLVSTNNGASFALDNAGLPASSGFYSFTGAKEGGVTRLFGVVGSSGDLYPGIQGSDYANTQDVYKRDFGSGNWALANTGIAAGDYPFFVGMAQNDIDVVYTAGATAFPSHPTVYKSTNGGSNWSKVLLTTNNQNVGTGWMGQGGDRNWGWAECALGFTVCPNNANIAIVTDFGFAHVTTNGGTNWTQAYVDAAQTNPANANTPPGLPYSTSGLNNTASWWLAWTTANDLYAAYTDITGVRSTTGGDTWKFSNSGNGYNSTYQYLKHPANSTVYACVSSIHDIYQSTYLTDARLNGGTGEILFSTNGGTSWSSLENFADPVVFMAIDPTNNDIAYASVVHSTNGGIFRTANLSAGAASTWTKVTNPPRTEGHPYNVFVLNDGSVVCTYSGRRNPGGSFTASSGVFYSTDGGTTWADRSDPGMFYWTKDITIDPHDLTQNTWYVGVFSGWGGPPNGLGGIYKTTNKGVNWTKINSLDRVEQIAIHPNDADTLYVTTEYDGLWFCTNATSGTPAFSWLDEYPFQHPMRVFFNPFDSDEVWVTSFGNSIRMGTTAAVCVPNLLLENMTIPSGIYLSSGDLTARNATVANSSTVIFRSDTGVLLEHSFTVELGGDFSAEIQSCPGN